METVKGPDGSQEYLLSKLIDQYQAVQLNMCFYHKRSVQQKIVYDIQ